MKNSDDSLDNQLKDLYCKLREHMKFEFNRHVSFGDLFSDRWETAKFYGFGENSSCYNNVLIIGDVKVGKNTWIGPNVILDGSGGLTIGDFCSISAGAQIYTHDSVKWSNSLGKKYKEYGGVTIGNGVYIGPQAVIQRNTHIGDFATIGAMSFVNKNVPPNSKAYGIPATIS